MSQISRKSFEDGETSPVRCFKLPFLLSNGQNDAESHGFVSQVVSSHFTTDRISANGGVARKIFLPYNTRTCFCLLSGKRCAIFSKSLLLYNGHFSAVFFLSIGEEKMSPLSKKRGHHDLRILRFERTASTAAVRTRGENAHPCLTVGMRISLLRKSPHPFRI